MKSRRSGAWPAPWGIPARTKCCYDLPWNPMRIEQRIGCIHRIGQTREVLIYNLCAAETMEDYILDILDRKINMFEMVVGEIDMIMGRMRGEQDFTDMIYDIWVNESSDCVLPLHRNFYCCRVTQKRLHFNKF